MAKALRTFLSLMLLVNVSTAWAEGELPEPDTSDLKVAHITLIPPGAAEGDEEPVDAEGPAETPYTDGASGAPAEKPVEEKEPFPYRMVLTCDGTTGTVKHVLDQDGIPPHLCENGSCQQIGREEYDGPLRSDEFYQACQRDLKQRQQLDGRCAKLIEGFDKFEIDKLGTADRLIAVTCMKRIEARKPQAACRDKGGLYRAQAWSYSKRAGDAAKKGNTALAKELYAKAEVDLKKAREQFAAAGQGCKAASGRSEAPAFGFAPAALIDTVRGWIPGGAK